MARYASDTKVSVDKTRSDIEKILRQHGADQFMYASSGCHAQVGFVISDRMIKITLNLPDPTDREFTHTPARGNKRAASESDRAWEQACRSRWRALLLVIKAKLEAAAIGVSTIEEEFLAYTVLPGGQTVMDSIGGSITKAIDSGVMPRALLPGLCSGDD